MLRIGNGVPVEAQWSAAQWVRWGKRRRNRSDKKSRPETGSWSRSFLYAFYGATHEPSVAGRVGRRSGDGAMKNPQALLRVLNRGIHRDVELVMGLEPATC